MTTTQLPWRLAGLVTAVLAAGALRWITAAPMQDPLRDSALVRLTWSARPEFIEHCRRLSDEELAKRPAHMRMRLQSAS